MESVGDRIESALKSQGLSARELARKAGLGETQISTILRRYRKNPNAEVALPTILQIADALGVSVEWLATGKTAPRAEEPAPRGADDFPYPAKTIRDLSSDLRELRHEGNRVDVQLHLLVRLLDDLVLAGNHAAALLLVNEAKMLLEEALRQIPSVPLPAAKAARGT